MADVAVPATEERQRLSERTDMSMQRTAHVPADAPYWQPLVVPPELPWQRKLHGKRSAAAIGSHTKVVRC